MRAALAPLSLLAGLLGARLAQEPEADAVDVLGHFHYDRAETVPTQRFGTSEAYEPCIRVDGDETWLAWLEFTPGEGDRIHVARVGGGDEEFTSVLPEPPARFARPTLTRAEDGRWWLTWEARPPGAADWNLFARSLDAEGRWGERVPICLHPGADLSHSVAAAPESGLWVAWQRDAEGQFDVFARRVAPLGPLEHLSASERGDWAPRITMAGDVPVVVWDAWMGDFDVLGSRRIDGRWAPPTRLASGSRFQARATVASGADGRVWIAWEEGRENWGEPYRSVVNTWNNATDASGPVHGMRQIQVREWTREGLREPRPFPMPALDRARARDDRRPGVEALGVFYERPELAVDGLGRPWLAYRHYAELQLGEAAPTKHHIERGWRVYATCLDEEGWSEPVRFDEHQRDGMQRLSVAGTERGLAAAFTTGRTDRREDDQTRGVVLSTAERPKSDPPGEGRAVDTTTRLDAFGDWPRGGPSGIEDGFGLYFGDLHRHTDLSLCFPFYDGSIDDAYRYAIEAAELDFLGITDHTRDIDRGNVQSQLWWRSIKEVERHRLRGTFHPYFAFERSHRDSDHNVISLRDDMLRNFPPPLPEYWAAIDEDTITIPHNPFIGKVWEHHDDAKRPLLEIYQGYRDQDSVEHAHEALAHGHHLGFIASSDHLSTQASYAGVWAPEGTRESIFRSLQARRTFGATCKMELSLRTVDAELQTEHWMGEIFEAVEPPSFLVSVRAGGRNENSRLEVVRFVVDGSVAEELEVPSADFTGRRRFYWTTWTPDDWAPGEHSVYVHVMQADGNQAWSSPLWVTIPAEDGAPSEDD